MKIIFYFFLIFSNVCFIGRKQVIGIVTVEHPQYKNQSTYLYASYTKWFEQYNIRWIPIDMFIEDSQLYQILDKIQGVFFPGGSQDFYQDSKKTQYLSIVEKIINYAKQINDNTKNNFIVMGTCLGFESMSVILSNEQLQMKHAKNNDVSISINLQENFQKSNLSKLFNQTEIDFFKEQIFFFHHVNGVLMEDVKNSQFEKENYILGTYLTEDNQEGLVMFENIKYPFIAWQFHPEKVQFENNDSIDINHTMISQTINRKFALFFKIMSNWESELTNEQILQYRKKGNLEVNPSFSSMDESWIYLKENQNEIKAVYYQLYLQIYYLKPLNILILKFIEMYKIIMNSHDNILQFLNLPKRKQIDVYQKYSNDEQVLQTQKQIENLISQYYQEYDVKLRQDCKCGKCGQKYCHQFQFPPTFMDLNFDHNEMQQSIPKFDENLSRQKLNDEQLKSLHKNGKFDIQSQKFNIDYTWKIWGLFYQGEKKRIMNFRTMIAQSYMFLLHVKRFYSYQKFKNCIKKERIYSKTIWASLSQCFMILINFFELFFGTPFYTNNNMYDQYLQEIDKEFLQSQDQKLLKNNILLVNYLQNKNSQEFKIFKKISMESNDVWNNFKEQQIQAAGDLEESEYEELVYNINLQKFDFMKNYLQQNQDLDQELIQALIKKFQALQISRKEFQIYEKNKNEFSKEIQNTLKEKYKYMSRIDSWKINYERKQMKMFKEEEQKIMFQNKSLQFKELNLKEENYLLNHYDFTYNMMINNKKLIREFIDQNKQTQEMRIRKFLMRPYEIEQIKNFEYSNKYHYILKKNIYIYVEKNFIFWRTVLALKRFFIHSRNLIIKSYKLCFYHQYGIKGLFYCKEYYLEYSIDKKTGELYKNQQKQVPWLVMFHKVLQGIKKSRQNFENNKKLGLFGKGISRVCNYIECYIFRLIIVGIFLILLLRPIFQILFIIATFIYGTTSPLWILIKLICQFLFKTFIYDYERTKYKRQYNYCKDVFLVSTLSRHQTTYKWFPFFMLILYWLFFGIVQLIHCLIMTVLFPILSLLIFIWAILRFLLRYILDFITFYLFIKPCAHTPQTNTSFAQQISGPGISQNLFYTISLENCVLMMIAKLELLKLNFYGIQVKEKLQENEKQFKICMEQIQPMNINMSFHQSQINQDILIAFQNQLSKHSDKIQKIFKVVNHLSTLKFTEEELKQLNQSCLHLLKHRLQDFYLQDYIWEYYEVNKGQYKLLTQRFIKSVFENFGDVYESIQDFEKKVEVKNINQNILSKEVMKNILKGKENLFGDKIIIKMKEKNKSYQQWTQLDLNQLKEEIFQKYPNYKELRVQKLEIKQLIQQQKFDNQVLIGI